ncbi:hypothetical protein CY0110_16247 [Crocosphaera chwakensis CCY0110]|uniref:Uncharacterized protein n=1 Tax=Crocosphaera chwakensis CCY0110 TaxID=391612 RepID=A3IHT1_9CHRO|nr:hypothetical protein CY0110_16247 [Crocosphaera chwakensis CCY0110]
MGKDYDRIAAICLFPIGKTVDYLVITLLFTQTEVYL